MLQPHTIKAARGAKHAPKRVGRGDASGHGKSSTRGGKGQTARSGGQRGNQARSFKRLLQSTPKLRGFTSHKVRPVEVYLTDLEKHFAAGDMVTIATLQEKKLISGTAKSAKILNSGTLTKKLVIQGITATKAAAELIKKAGGELK
jgi:large subunit ribosomal protein L15